MTKRKFLLVLAAGLILGIISGCSKELPVQAERTLSPSQGPGAFGVSYLKGLAKTRQVSSVQSGENVSFNLGNLKGSTAFYFLLYNIGGKPITNVKLQIPDSNFAVFPSTIDTLIPGGDVGMLPVVKVSAYHGTALDGAGARPVMSMGENATELKIEGTTKNVEGKDTVVNMAAGLKLMALVMDIEVKGDSGRIIDLTYSPCGTIGTQKIDGFDVINMRSYCLFDEKIIFTNTGNVPITFKSYAPSSLSLVLNEIMQPGDSIQVELVKAYDNYYFSLDGGNVVSADYRKLRMEDNGVCYFMFNRMVPNP